MTYMQGSFERCRYKLIDSHIITNPVFVAQITAVSVFHEIRKRVTEADEDAVWTCHAMLPRNAWRAKEIVHRRL